MLREAGDGDCKHHSYGPSELPHYNDGGSARLRERSTPTFFPDVPDHWDSGPDNLLPPGFGPDASVLPASPLPPNSILDRRDSGHVPFFQRVSLRYRHATNPYHLTERNFDISRTILKQIRVKCCAALK